MITITFFDTIADFWDKCKGFLLQKEVDNNIIIKNCLNAIDSGVTQYEGGFAAAVINERGEVLLAALITPPFSMVIAAADETDRNELLPLLAKEIVQRGFTLPGVGGAPFVTTGFAIAYSELTQCEKKPGKNLTLYILDEVNDVAKPDGIMRAAKPSDMAFLPYWYTEFDNDCNMGGSTPLSNYSGANSMVEKGSLFVWENDGTPVSIAATQQRTPNYAVINRVYTPPYWRGKGYSAATVVGATKWALQNIAQHCCLYADKLNPISNHIYQKIGYKQYSDYYVIDFIPRVST